MSTIPQVELLRCPFCGGEQANVHQSGSAWFIGGFHADNCHFADFQRTEAEAIAAWNTRASTPQAPQEVVEREPGLRKFLQMVVDWGAMSSSQFRAKYPDYEPPEGYAYIIRRARSALDKMKG